MGAVAAILIRFWRFYAPWMHRHLAFRALGFRVSGFGCRV